MMFASHSVSVATNRATTSIYATAASGFLNFMSFNLCKEFAQIPFCFYAKKAICKQKFVQLLAAQEGNLSRTITVCATSGNDGEPEESGTTACTNYKVLAHTENCESSRDAGDEVVTSILYSGADLNFKAENLGNQDNLFDKLKAVHLHILAMEQWNASRLKLCHRTYLVSAANLIHYVALKSLDIEQLKADLSSLGLMNLETINPHVLASLSAGIQMLENLKSNSVASKTSGEISNSKILSVQKKKECTVNRMAKKGLDSSKLLLGPLREQRTSHIMVTVGEEAAESETLITDLLKTGATIIRINCAHGNPATWNEIIRRVKRSSQMLEAPCRIIMDLAGPKLRTDKLKAGPCIMKISPKKNAAGNVIFPAQIWLSPQGGGPPPSHASSDAVLYIDGQEFLSKLEIGDNVTFCDARGKKRILRISNKYSVFSGVGLMAECKSTAYVKSGTKLYIKGKKTRSAVGFVRDVPPVEQFVRLRIGDLLVISRDSLNEHELSSSTFGSPRVTCSSGYLFDSVKPGEPIAFDDGKIWGVIKGTSISEIIVSITHAGPRGTKLGSEKSINIPESDIHFEGLTSKDLMDLDFVATHADMVGVSFVRDVKDIILLRQEIAKRNLRNLGIILKIETKGGYKNLPLMLLEAMKSPNPLGVMIARGDLAVECGWEKLADIQDEILSTCSAAHVPVIWATQVLESLTKSGVPTRAEITDAASGRRANCVMLNKGKHIVEAVSTLDTILKTCSTELSPEVKPLMLSSHLS